jgi:prepilin-type N-terminal cleavage/methylation domain-containing protein
MQKWSDRSSGGVRRRGVTLLELLVVVTLMGILSSVVVSRYGRDIFGDFGARSEAQQLWLDLEAGRRMAIRSGKEHSIVFSGPVNGSWTGYDIVEGTSAEARTGKGTSVSGDPRVFPKELVVDGGVKAVSFSFEGHASEAAQWRLTGPNRSWQVRLVPLSGAATVSELGP